MVGVADAAAAAEGDSASFTVALSAPSGRDVAVAFATADAGALAGEDYAARSATLGIPAGATSATIAVALLDDGADEPDEQLRAADRLAGIGHARPGNARARRSSTTTSRRRLRRPRRR